MKTTWEHHFPEQIIFGVGAVENLDAVLRKLKTKDVLLVTDPGVVKAGVAKHVISNLETAGYNILVYDQAIPEPTFDSVLDCVSFIKNHRKPDIIIALGGGSSIDLAKATALINEHGGHPSDYVGEHLIPGKITPLIAIPTTAGTGSEVTSVAVLTDEESNLKVGISDNNLRPQIALLDPELTIGLPAYVTACSGIDALSHAIEAYTSKNFAYVQTNEQVLFQGSLPISDIFALRSIELIANNLSIVVQQGSNLEARKNMMLGSLYAGLALSNTGTAAAHALAYPIGGLVKSPHGEVTGLLLPYVMEYNAAVAEEKMIHISKAFRVDVSNMDRKEASLKASALVMELIKEIGLPTKLSKIGVHEDDIPTIAEKAVKIDRLIRNNPRVPNVTGFKEILNKSF